MKMTMILGALLSLAACNGGQTSAVSEAHAKAPSAVGPSAVGPSAAAPSAAAPSAVASVPVGTQMKCPVSGDDFTVKAGTQQVVYKGKSYAFCCADCLPDFNKNPAKYAKQ